MFTGLINGFMDLVSAAESTADIGRAFLSTVEQFGYKDLSIFDLTKIAEPFSSTHVFLQHTAKKEFSSFNRRLRFADHPSVRYAIENDQPCDFDELRQKLGMEPEEWEEVVPPNLLGMRCIVLPVHRENEPKLMVGCMGPRADVSPPARAALHTCAHVVYDRIRTLQELSQRESVLTKREAECLYWASKGKTDAETGKILNIAQRTVRFHIGNAKQKLNAETRIQAITKKATR